MTHLGDYEDAMKGVGLATLHGDRVTLEGADPILDTRFPLASAAAIAHGLVGDRVIDLWARRTGLLQTASVALPAAAASLVSFALMRLRSPRGDLDGWEPSADGDGWVTAGSLGVLAGHNPPNAATNAYRTADGRWIQLHGGYPHLAAGLYELLDVAAERDAVAREIATRSAFELEDTIAAANLCGVVARTNAEWLAHPQGQALAARPVIDIVRTGDAPPRQRVAGERPLSGVRVLDLTRVLAGPTCARALAAHGADVLNVRSPSAPFVVPFILETGFGKRSALYHLPPAGAGELEPLARTADIVCDSYRTGSLERHGLGPAALAEQNPGVIVVQLNCYGFGGPWDGRRGWEQLAQNAVGLATPDDSRAEPVIAPAAACDYITGAMLTAGVLEALRRQEEEGGSWLVRGSLCRTGMWLHALPRVDPAAAPTGLGSLADLVDHIDTAWGHLEHLRPLPRLDRTPAYYASPPVPLGTHQLGWQP